MSHLRRITTIMILAVALITATAYPMRAQDLSNSQRLLGYTLTDDIDISGVAFGQAGTYSIGAVLEPAALAPYAGCHVVGIRLAAATNLGRTRMFLYNFTDTSFDVLIEQKQRIYQGWNNVFFNGDGYEIQGDETLFFGFDYVETDDMVAAEEGGLACVGSDTDGAFYLYGDYGQGEGLYTISGAGMLCVQLIIDVSSLPMNDMAFTYLDAGFKYKLPGENIEVLASFINTGRDSIRTYQLGYRIDDYQAVLINRNDTIADGRQESWMGNVTLPDDIASGMHTLQFFVSSINGQVIDSYADSKHIETQFAVYRDNVDRQKVYLEVYNDQGAPYSAMLNDAVRAMQQKFGQVCVVNVHKPGTMLSVSEADYLSSLYAYTYPSFTVNRAYFPGEAYVAYDMNDYLPFLGTEMSAAILTDIVMQDIYSPSFATIDLRAGYNSNSRQLSITAAGQLLPEATAIYGDVALTLLVTEDSVVSQQTVYNAVTGRTSVDHNYRHNDVLRTYVTSPTGQLLVPDGDHYSVHLNATLDDSWVPEHLHVVGLLTKAVSEVTADNLLDMDVINATSIQISGTTAIQSVQPEHACTTQRGAYGLDGRPVSTLHSRGIIVRNGKKFVVK